MTDDVRDANDATAELYTSVNLRALDGDPDRWTPSRPPTS
jgi:hypothetical protein